ncbi:MAG TPA: hypothetical protein VMT85_21530 [Thermoanaerobaculia bacterium]|nr:hypothetical protein [Thermoanaerobaculia bacterium]
MPALDRAHRWMRSSPFLYRFTLFTRILLAAGFLPTGMVKLLGERFTTIPVDQPIGAFFEAMYQTGLYWQFLGASQVAAAVLLLIPPVAHLGAAMFLPIILNIVVITISLGFRGTPVIVALMLLAVLYLSAWDYHRFRPLLTTAALDRPVPSHRLDRSERLGFALFGLSLISFFGVTRSFLRTDLAQVCVLGGIAAGLLTLGRFTWISLHPRAGGAPAAMDSGGAAR